MARHGENIRKRKDGRWEGRYLAYHVKKCRKLYHSVYGRTYEEVKIKLTVKKYSLLEAWDGGFRGKAGEEVVKKPEDAGTGTAGEMKDGAAGKGKMDGREAGEKEQNERGTDEGGEKERAMKERRPDEEGANGKEMDERGTSRRKINGGGTEGKETGGRNAGETVPNPGKTWGKLMFIDAAAEWLNEVKRSKKPSTYVKYSLVCRIHLEPLFQDTEISDVAANALFMEKCFDGLSESIRKSIYCVLNQVLAYASRRYGITISNLKKPVFHGRKKPVEILTKKEQASLLSVLLQGTDKAKAAVLLCLHTGLRLGELCSLKWGDIDFGNMVVSVNRTVQRLYTEGRQTKTVLLETGPKSEYSRREIPLPPAVLRLLEKIRHSSEYIFGEKKPMEPRTLQNHFRKLMGAAGLGHKNFHILRHTFATNCVEGGTDVKCLSEILGHSNVQISLNRYVHPTMDSKRRHLDSLSEFYGRMCG